MIDAYLDPAGTPPDRPGLAAMDAATRGLHEGIDAAIRRAGVPYLHPDGATIQLDLLGSGPMVRWQERKQELMFLGSACWSDMPQIYGRYGTTPARRLLARVRDLERAQAAVLTDTGMQACALLFDAVLEPGDHVACARGVYNKSKAYLSRLTTLLGGELTLVDDLSRAGLAAALRPATRLLFLETYTNPLMRAVDPQALARAVGEARAAGAARLVVALDTTIATPWGLAEPGLRWEGVDVVAVSGTKALAGQDRDMWGYLASDDVRLLNGVMDLQAMRGGIVDWRRAAAILDGLDRAEPRFRRRCATAREVTRFLAGHPLVEAVFHPSAPGHPDAAVIERHYTAPGSIVSFRLRGADEAQTRHFCDVLATCGVLRYALSFDGLATKLNHHRSVSEYFTAAEEVRRIGVDRLVRLGIGVEHPGDLIACLNWALWHRQDVAAAQVEAWQAERAGALGIAAGDRPATLD